jgi:hypothetical protein
VTRVTPGPSTCQAVVPTHLAKVVGEVTGTLGLQDFRTSEDLECSIVEISKGMKARDT